MLITQEPKYDVDSDGRLFNRATRAGIPDDEPVFVLRAKDRHAVNALLRYMDLCANAGRDSGHLAEVFQRLTAFIAFREAHPERMKEPDGEPVK